MAASPGASFGSLPISILRLGSNNHDVIQSSSHVAPSERAGPPFPRECKMPWSSWIRGGNCWLCVISMKLFVISLWIANIWKKKTLTLTAVIEGVLVRVGESHGQETTHTCPITLDLFKDPVTLCTGQTYDRSSIEKWLSAGNLTCPVTMQKLNDPTIVPNHTLRHLIDQWLHTGQLHFASDYLITVDSLAALKQNLDSHEANLETKLQSLEIILVLTEESPSQVPSLLHFGFLDSLLELLFPTVESEPSQEHKEFAEQALCCVKRLLPFCELESLNMLKEKSRLESFLALFERGDGVIKQSLCQLIEGIASYLETRELCAILGKTQKLLQGLVLLLHQNCEESDSGIKAISAMCSLEPNRQNLVQESVVEGLIAYISDAERGERSLAPRAMATLELLLGLESAKEALINSKDGIKMIVKMVFKVSSDHESSESAVKSLIIICNDSLKAREAAMAAGVLSQSLLLLQSQCSNRTKTKARMLLKLLRSKWVEDTKHL